MLRLLLVMLATNTSREKAFPEMKKIRMSLHSSIKSNLLNHFMVVHVHTAHEISREFLGNNQTRLREISKSFLMLTQLPPVRKLFSPHPSQEKLFLALKWF